MEANVSARERVWKQEWNALTCANHKTHVQMPKKSENEKGWFNEETKKPGISRWASRFSPQPNPVPDVQAGGSVSVWRRVSCLQPSALSSRAKRRISPNQIVRGQTVGLRPRYLARLGMTNRQTDPSLGWGLARQQGKKLETFPDHRRLLPYNLKSFHEIHP
jgi:hypothetical protein